MQILEAHGTDQIRPIQQLLAALERECSQTGDAGRAVDQAQAFLRLEHERLQTRGLQRRRPAAAFAVNSGVTRSEQHQRDVRHVRQVSHRPVRRNLGYAVPREQCEQAFDHFGPHAGIPMRKVVDRGRDDRTNRRRLERGPHGNRVAHDDVVRQLPLLGLRHDDLAERADARIHTVGANALLDDRLHQAARRLDAAARGRGQGKRGALRDCGDLAPGERAIEQDVRRHGPMPIARAGRAIVRGGRDRARAPHPRRASCAPHPVCSRRS